MRWVNVGLILDQRRKIAGLNLSFICGLTLTIHNLKWLKITDMCLIWEQTLVKSWWSNTHFIPDNSRLIKRIKTDNCYD